jgi:ADP-heptose:LPS heptosyltransferase
MIHTPVLFIIFNRPDVTALVFDEIRKAQPSRLFVAADGPRANRPMDEVLCKEARAIISQVDWPCEVKTLFREQNLGCGHAVSSAISWFFSQVEEGIILEDDCLPHPTFFTYCQDLLEYYRNDTKVMHIGGVNFQNGHKRGDASYYFSGVAHVWGWASWRRAWDLYNFNVSDFYTFVRDEKIYEYFPNEKLAMHWLDHFKSMYYHKIDTWDHQWSYAVLNNHGVSVIPNTNLISNIGFREDATHTSSSNSVYAYAKTYPIARPLVHPQTIEVNKEADFYFFKEVDHLPLTEPGFSFPLASRIRSLAARLVEYSLRRFVFSPKIKHPKKHILIQKVDAIGDYIITRNFFEALIKSNSYKSYRFYLLANKRLKSFIEETDKKIFEEVIYFNEDDLKKIKTKYAFYFKLRSLKLDTIIHATFSRSVVTDDIIFHAGAPRNIGFSGDTSNISESNKSVTDTYYSQLIDVDAINNDPFTHEFEKQRTFFETIIGEAVSFKMPDLSDVVKPAKEKIISVCPGSNEEYKKWNTGKFSQLIVALSDQFPEYRFQIICGPGENELGDQIMNDMGASFKKIELINTESILHLITCISRSTLVIANDSAPIHIAAAFAINSVCIFNGSRYGRFVPYPSALTHTSVVVVPKTLLVAADPNSYYNRLTYMDIDKVEVQDVLKECINKLQQGGK